MIPQKRNISAMFTAMSAPEYQAPAHNGHNGHEGTLEAQFNFLNSRLRALNDEILRLEHQRDSVYLRRNHVWREIEIQRKRADKEEMASGKRTV